MISYILVNKLLLKSHDLCINEAKFNMKWPQRPIFDFLIKSATFIFKYKRILFRLIWIAGVIVVFICFEMNMLRNVWIFGESFYRFMKLQIKKPQMLGGMDCILNVVDSYLLFYFTFFLLEIDLLFRSFSCRLVFSLSFFI